MDKELENYSYSELGNAIVVQAVKDYERALKSSRKSKVPDSKVISLERFFRSKWYSTLTTLDGEIIISKIRKQILG